MTTSTETQECNAGDCTCRCCEPLGRDTSPFAAVPRFRERKNWTAAFTAGRVAVLGRDR